MLLRIAEGAPTARQVLLRSPREVSAFLKTL